MQTRMHACMRAHTHTHINNNKKKSAHYSRVGESGDLMESSCDTPSASLEAGLQGRACGNVREEDADKL